MTNTKKLFAGIFSLILAKDAGATVYYYTYKLGKDYPATHICGDTEQDIISARDRDMKHNKLDCSPISKGMTTLGCYSMNGKNLPAIPELGLLRKH